MADLLNMSNPVFRSFMGYAGVILGKTVVMSVVTSYHRVTKKVFATEEDVVRFKAPKGIILDNPDVERVRRAHQNDLENVLPFVLLGAIYCTTGPSLESALLHFRIFTAARIAHTVIYLFKVPQPARLLTFMAGFGVNVSLVCHIVSQAAF